MSSISLSSAITQGWNEHPATQQKAAIEQQPAFYAEINGVKVRPKATSWVRIAPDILRAMSVAAQHAGKPLSDVWAEAAREWLLHTSLEAEYDVLSNQPERRRGPNTVEEMRHRLWGKIDSAMGDLRESSPIVSAY